MRMRRCLALLICLVALCFAPVYARAATIKVLSDGALELALPKIADRFSHAGGDEVKFEFESSPALQNKVIGGEIGDVIVIKPDFVDALVAAGKLTAVERPVVGRVGLGLATRADGPTWNVLTTDSFKSALLDADMLVFDTGDAGDQFAKVLDRLELTDAVKRKILRTDPSHVIARVVADQGNDIAVARMTDIVVTKGLKVIGAVPGEFQSYAAYVAIPLAGAQDVDAAKSFIHFLTSPSARGEFFGAGIN
jgi:molybdate transport system substrate-binding protein